MDLLIMAKVHGDDKVRRMFATAPGVFRNEYLRWLLKENEMFIGSKKMDGAFRRKLYAQRRWSDQGQWRSQVANLFKGIVVDPVNGQRVNFKTLNANVAGTGFNTAGISMSLRMGLLYRQQKQIHKALEFLEEGGPISSSKYMPIPIAGRGMVKPYQKFQYWLKTGMFNVVYKGGLAYYFLKGKGKKDRDALAFVGYKRTNVRFAHRFSMAFENRKPGIEVRAQAATNIAVEKAERVGY